MTGKADNKESKTAMECSTSWQPSPFQKTVRRRGVESADRGKVGRLWGEMKENREDFEYMVSSLVLGGLVRTLPPHPLCSYFPNHRRVHVYHQDLKKDSEIFG